MQSQHTRKPSCCWDSRSCCIWHVN